MPVSRVEPMPSFVCDYCQETLKKAKLDQHAQRCRQAAFSCIDCYKTFKGVEYRAHSSCITEVQKHHTIKGKDGRKVQNVKASQQKSNVTEPEAKKSKVEPPKIEEISAEMALVMAQVPKTGSASLKDLLKAVKKDKVAEKKARKSAKKWLLEKLCVSLENGKPFFHLQH